MLKRALFLLKRLGVVSLFASFFFFWSCSPSSLSEFQREGEAVSRELLKDLQQIQTVDDLTASFPLLKKRFSDLVDVIIQARLFQEETQEVLDPDALDLSFNELLMIELKRIYQMERGREIIEKAQREPLNRLDSFERKVKMRKERIVASG